MTPRYNAFIVWSGGSALRNLFMGVADHVLNWPLAQGGNIIYHKAVDKFPSAMQYNHTTNDVQYKCYLEDWYRWYFIEDEGSQQTIALYYSL